MSSNNNSNMDKHSSLPRRNESRPLHQCAPRLQLMLKDENIVTDKISQLPIPRE